jgi:DNA repair exonuclease SbcCD ATPase subunit
MKCNGIVETGISGIPLDSQWIFLTGENGFGKTSILQALTIGLFGDRDVNCLLLGDQKDCEVGVEISAEGKNVIKRLYGLAV